MKIVKHNIKISKKLKNKKNKNKNKITLKGGNFNQQRDEEYLHHYVEYSKINKLDKTVLNLNNKCYDYDISNLKISDKTKSQLNCNYYSLDLIKYISQGSYNITFLSKNSKDNKYYCLRLTKINLDDITEKNELDGLYLQSYLTLPTDKGGVGCKYICGCYGFGKYKFKSDINNNILNISSRKGVYGILEYISGGDLFNEMERKIYARQRFSEINVSEIIGRLLIAVNCIHQHNFVHLDIKPENILCSDTDNRDIRLIDFGFIKYIPVDTLLNPRVDGSPGTPGYVAPEIINGENYNQKADIWSIGVTMLNLLLLTNDLKTYMYNRKSKYSYVDIYKLLNILRRNFSEDCIDLLLNMLNVNQNNRYSALQCLEHKWIKPYLPSK